MTRPAADHLVPSIIETMGDAQLFAPWFTGSSWDAWRCVLRAAFALPMTKAQRKLFHTLAERDPPKKPVRELWVIAGRRCGKDSVASLIAAHAASFFDPRGRLRPGEKASVVCLATDKDQARIVLNYIKAFFSDVGYLHSMVERETVNGLELSNGVEVIVSQNDFRAVRGRAVALCICDELAFWRSENSASPDTEVFNAIKPGTMTLGGIIIGISSPHRKAGLLYEKWREHYGQDGDVLVVRAPSIALNPLLDAKEIDAEIARDPAVGNSEWNALWRDDLATFISRDLIEAAVDSGVTVRPPIQGVSYKCFIDPSGGVSDSMTLGIAHLENDLAVLDCVIERASPFNAQAVVSDFVKVMREYGCGSAESDRYAQSWVSQSFAAHGVVIIHSRRDRSAIYSDCLPLFTSGKARLLDVKRLISQFCALERRTTAARDKIDHPDHGKDDVCNSAAGAMVMANDRSQYIPMTGMLTFRELGFRSLSDIGPAPPEPAAAAPPTGDESFAPWRDISAGQTHVKDYGGGADWGVFSAPRKYPG